jgi:hypothetical protein
VDFGCMSPLGSIDGSSSLAASLYGGGASQGPDRLRGH